MLSLYLSFFSSIEGCNTTGIGVTEEVFDLRSEKEFWEEIKRGLVFLKISNPYIDQEIYHFRSL